MVVALLVTNFIVTALAVILLVKLLKGTDRQEMTSNDLSTAQIEDKRQEQSAIIDSDDLALQEFLATTEGRNATFNDLEEIYK